MESVGRCFESLRLGRGRIENRAHTDVRDEKREEQQEDIENEDPLYYLTLDPKEWKVCLPVCQFFCPFVCLSVWLSVCVSICLFVCQFAC